MSSGARVLVVGLDGATFDLVDPLVAAGKMPNLAALLASGTRSALNSTTPPMTLPAWSSFITGSNPGRHGILDFVHRVPGTYRLELSHAGYRLVPTMHEWISSLGGRVASIAVPTTWPPSAVNGVVISGFDSPVATSIDRRFVHPPAMYDEIQRRFGGMAFADFQELHIGSGWHEAARASLLREIGRKEAICRWLLASERWDSFMVVFGETDTASHHFWMFHDPHSPRFRASSPEVQATIADVYTRADQALGALIASADPDLVCVASDHGFGGAGSRALYLNRFLEARGWLAWKPRGSGPSWVDAAKRAALRHLPADAQQRLVRALRGSVLDRLETNARWGDIEWSRTSAWSDEMNYASTIHLNVAGRDPLGVITDRDGAISALTADLLAWREDGEPVVDRVQRREDLYSGDAVDRSPDLVLTLRHPEGYTDTMLPSRQAAPGQTSRRLQPSEFLGGKGLGMNGTHRQRGVLVLAGRGIANGEVAAEMIDPMPTILAATATPIPDHCDGRVLQEAFTAPTRAAWRTSNPTPSASTPHSEVDAAQLRRRLESLGYL